jgi:hypothetical protein
VDQSLYASYIRAVVEADHTLPRSVDHTSFRAALETDQHSRFHQLAIMLKNNQNLVSMAAYFVFGISTEFIFGTDYRYLAVLSILFSVLSCGLAATWTGYLVRSANNRLLYLPILISFFCYGLAYYPNWFSSFGPHNLGVLGLLIGAISLQWAVDRAPSSSWDGKTWRILLLVHAFAFLTHWTTVILLLPVSLLAILIHSKGVRSAIKPAIEYIVFAGFIVILPWVGMHLISGDSITSSTKWLMGPVCTENHFSLSIYFFRVVDWFKTASFEFSVFGLVSGILGCVYLALIKKKYLPICVTLVHFLCWVVLPGFTDNGTPTFLRTINYLFPFLAIGIGALCVLPFSPALPKNLKPLVICGIVFPLIAHFTMQFRPLAYQNELSLREPRFIDAYLRGQDTLRPFAATADTYIPDGSTIFANHYSARVNFQTMRPDIRKKLNWLPELDSMLEQTKAGNYNAYSQRRGIAQSCKPMYLFSRDELTSPAELEQSVQTVFGRNGMGCSVGTVSLLQHWVTNISAFESVTLFRIDLAEQGANLK